MLKKKNSYLRLIFFLVIAVISILLVISLYSRKKQKEPIIQNNASVNNKNVDSSKIGCTRTTRLGNDPQYDRALSLIQQRLVLNQKRFKYNNRALFTSFSPELTNCIKVVERPSKKDDDFEGYFTFNGEDIQNDYYPIVVQP